MANRHRVLEIVGILAFFGLELVLAWRLVAAVDDAASLVLLALALLTGYVAADFFSGLVHWLFDRYFTVETPIVGEHFVRPFREHHVDPKGITRHGFVETNGNNCIATAPVLAAAVALPIDTASWALFAAGMSASLCLFVFGTNQFHKWSHEAAPPRWVRFLQAAGLILGEAHHDIHHTPPFDRYYCITTGWLNAPLHAVRFFPRLEAVIERLTGVRAGADDRVFARVHGIELADQAVEAVPTEEPVEATVEVRRAAG